MSEFAGVTLVYGGQVAVAVPGAVGGGAGFGIWVTAFGGSNNNGTGAYFSMSTDSVGGQPVGFTLGGIGGEFGEIAGVVIGNSNDLAGNSAIYTGMFGPLGIQVQVPFDSQGWGRGYGFFLIAGLGGIGAAQVQRTWVGDVRDLFGLAESLRRIDPLVLDLNGDGVQLTALTSSRAFFDLDADGFAQQTGWVTGGDGVLALDRNGNGRIDDVTEVFGDATTGGFAALQSMDSNGDAVIDANDAEFSSLQIWVDADEDGFTDPGEL